MYTKCCIHCVICFLILGTAFPVSGLNDSTDSSVSVQDLVPPSGFLDGWTIEEGPEIYTPDNLYEIIDGAAPLYLSYGFRKQAYVRYVHEGDSPFGITAYIYDQGSVEGGFGVYSSSRHRNENFQAFGTQGYRSGTILSAWKGRFYIYLTGDRENEETVKAMESLARRITEQIPGRDSYPQAFQLLPEEGRVKNSEVHTEKSYLGYDSLQKSISALYQVKDSTATLFVAQYSDEEEMEKQYSLFQEAIATRNETVDLPYSNILPFAVKSRSLGKVLTTSYQHHIYGAYSKDNIEWNDLYQLLTRCSPLLSSPKTEEKKG